MSINKIILRFASFLLLLALFTPTMQVLLETPDVQAVGQFCDPPTEKHIAFTPGYGYGANGEYKQNLSQEPNDQVKKQEASGYDKNEFAAQVKVGFICVKQKAKAYQNRFGGGGWGQAKTDAKYGWWDDCKTTGKSGIVRRYNGACPNNMIPSTPPYVTEVYKMWSEKYTDEMLSIAQTVNNPRSTEIIEIDAAINGGCATEGVSDDVCDIIKAIWYHETRWQPGATNPEWTNKSTPPNLRCGKLVCSNIPGKMKAAGVGLAAVNNYFPGNNVGVVSNAKYEKALANGSIKFATVGASEDTLSFYSPEYDFFDQQAQAAYLDNLSSVILVANNDPTAGNESLARALETRQALPPGILNECQVNTTQFASTDKSKNNNVLMNCIRSILRIMFVIAILLLIIRIATIQLGFIANGGEDAGLAGSGQIVATRNLLRDGLIGLFLIGGAALILEVFNANIVSNTLF
jgi:hypothetical protein